MANNSSKTSKEGTVQEVLKKGPVKEGLICVIATVELCTALESYKVGYYWCMEKFEYTTDVMFESRDALVRIYHDLVDALVSFSCDDVT